MREIRLYSSYYITTNQISKTSVYLNLQNKYKFIVRIHYPPLMDSVVLLAIIYLILKVTQLPIG